MSYPINKLEPHIVAVRLADLATFLSSAPGKSFYRKAYNAAWRSWDLEIEDGLSREAYNEQVRLLKANARADAMTDVASHLGFAREELMEYSDCQDHLNALMWSNSTHATTVARKLLRSGLFRLTDKEKDEIWVMTERIVWD